MLSLKVESATLPVATFSKFQPLSKDFLDLSNPKAVLEMRLRHFACLSKGDIVAINYNKKIYELNVLETKVSSFSSDNIKVFQLYLFSPPTPSPS